MAQNLETLLMGGRQAHHDRDASTSPRPIENSPAELLEPLRTEIEFSDHAAGAAMAEQLFGVTPDLLRDGEAWATEDIRRLGTHNSTHVDAPWHYNSRIRGERAQTIDELPLEWFLAPGVVIDATGKARRRGASTSRTSRPGWRPRATRSRRSTSCWCGPAATPSTPSSTTSRAARRSRRTRHAGCSTRACA